MKLPKVSFVICTYNAVNLAKKCIDSIKSQNYPKDRREIICVDGGSTDSTLDLLKNYKIKIIHNKNRLPEGKGMGKYQGYMAAKGEYIAYVDQDNEVQGKNWLKEMLNPLIKEKKIFGSACRLLTKKSDPAINRYVSLIGTDPFAAYRSLDGVLGLKQIKLRDKGDYFTYELTLKNLIVAGGNCFIYRKKALDSIGGYTVDTDVMYSFAEKNSVLAIPKNARTWHHATNSIVEFIGKKMSWSKNYSERLQKGRKFKWIPEDNKGKYELIKNVLFNLTIVPNLFIAIRRYSEDKESAWLLHPIMAFIITAVYGLNFLCSKI
jgi:glycosyltransferase involved in cell wall biosynthesis